MRVIIPSCDAYLNVLWLSQRYFKHFWPDNPYPVDVISETKGLAGMVTYKYNDPSWVNRLLMYLRDTPHEHFIIIPDDFILKSPVNTERVRHAEVISNNDRFVGCIRLQPHDHQAAHLQRFSPGFDEYPLDKPYSVSFQISIWHREFLFEILKKGETVWQAEIGGSKRAKKSIMRVLWANEPAFNYTAHGYMQKGKPAPDVLRWVMENPI